jgi:hypothetical protein
MVHPHFSRLEGSARVEVQHHKNRLTKKDGIPPQPSPFAAFTKNVRVFAGRAVQSKATKRSSKVAATPLAAAGIAKR